MDTIDSPISLANGTKVTWCMFCGAKAGNVSERTNKAATDIFYCDKCWKIYCSECSYKDKNGETFCLRCDAKLVKVKH